MHSDWLRGPVPPLRVKGRAERVASLHDRAQPAATTTQKGPTWCLHTSHHCLASLWRRPVAARGWRLRHSRPPALVRFAAASQRGPQMQYRVTIDLSQIRSWRLHCYHTCPPSDGLLLARLLVRPLNSVSQMGSCPELPASKSHGCLGCELCDPASGTVCPPNGISTPRPDRQDLPPASHNELVSACPFLYLT